jgi:hypothetical protein
VLAVRYSVQIRRILPRTWVVDAHFTGYKIDEDLSLKRV